MPRGYLCLAFRLCYRAVHTEHHTQQSTLQLCPKVLHIPELQTWSCIIILLLALILKENSCNRIVKLKMWRIFGAFDKKAITGNVNTLLLRTDSMMLKHTTHPNILQKYRWIVLYVSWKLHGDASLEERRSAEDDTRVQYDQRGAGLQSGSSRGRATSQGSHARDPTHLKNGPGRWAGSRSLDGQLLIFFLAWPQRS